MDISNMQFEEWRKEQIASLLRMGYPDAAKSFRDLGSVQWAGWQAARASLVIDLPKQFKDADCRDLEELHEAIHTAGIRTK